MTFWDFVHLHPVYSFVAGLGGLALAYFALAILDAAQHNFFLCWKMRQARLSRGMPSGDTDTKQSTNTKG